MVSIKKFSYLILPIICLSLVFSGCSITIQKGRRSDMEKIDSLSSEVELYNLKLEKLQAEKEEEISELGEAKKLLEKKLKKEIGEKSVRLEMAEKGLAIIFLAEVIFDSGKVDIKKEAFDVLNKIAKILNNNIGNRNIGIEGHTDDEPIKHSGWKSNWELSTARATSVLHYLVEKRSVDPKRIAATGYGEYRPTLSNDTAENRRQNRRVEIVVLPKNIEKIEADMDKIAERKKKIQNRLKRYKK